ncbi:MAG: class I SAM-dependent methyltransferase [Pseudomonadota bacterium]
MRRLIAQAITQAGGWLPFDRYMALVLYAPGLGYYSRGSRQFGQMAKDGSDFVTAPELSPLFGRALARQVEQALQATGTDEVWEFGAGTGALAAQILQALDERGALPRRYTIVDLSGTLRARQQRTLARWADRVGLHWASELPAELRGVVVGNEVLDAMPVKLLAWDGGQWLERGVVLADDRLAWAEHSTELRPPVDAPFPPGSVTEIHPQAEAFMRTLAERLAQGAAFFIDYGFPEAEYYLPQRSGGTLMCHRGHQADADPLADPGDKDITAHVDFTGIALAGQNAGLTVLGYTTQAHFLLNCGLLDDLAAATAGLPEPQALVKRAAAHRLVAEHEMGELFKVIGFVRGAEFDAIGFARGDRCHTL